MCGRKNGDVPGFVCLGPANGDGQFCLYRAEGDAEVRTDRFARHAEQPADDGRWAKRFAEMQARCCGPALEKLAQALGLPLWALDVMAIGAGEDEAGSYWAFAERDGEENVIGIARRYPDGTKKTISGGKRGLTLSSGWKEFRGGVLHVVEGQSCCLALAAMGLSAVGRPSNVGGAKHLATLLRNLATDQRPVVVILGEYDQKPDGSWPGKQGSETVATQLQAALGNGWEIRWGLPPGNAKDARAWVTGRGLPAERCEEWTSAGAEFLKHVQETATKAEAKAPSKGKTVVVPPADTLHLTDLGNAQRINGRHGSELRYCHPWKTWMVWDGRRWARDETAEVVRRAKDTQRAFFKETAAALARVSDIENEEIRKQKKTELTQQLQHALRWEDNRDMGRAVDSLKSEPNIPVLTEQLDAQPNLFNVRNGTLDLDTGTLRPHNRADLLTKLAHVVYDPTAKCPTWNAFLTRIMDGNTDLIDYLQRLAGYGLSAETKEQSIWFFHGTGANGKSTFLGTLLAMMGDYGMQSVSDLLMVKNHESHPTERADLFGKRLVCTIETEEGKRLAESLMKQLTGEDRIRARKMKQDFFEFSPTHKIILCANHKPVIRGRDLAVWRRIKLVPFSVTITEEEKDKDLPAKLKAELSGILTWAADGYRKWKAHGMAEPDEVRIATTEYQHEQDTVGAFIAECCTVLKEARVKASLLFETYVNWSGDKLMTQKAFSQQILDKGFTKDRGHGGAVFYFSIGLPAAEKGDRESSF
jgi:P4 family phage/plasmid primase-like protien